MAAPTPATIDAVRVAQLALPACDGDYERALSAMLGAMLIVATAEGRDGDAILEAIADAAQIARGVLAEGKAQRDRLDTARRAVAS